MTRLEDVAAYSTSRPVTVHPAAGRRDFATRILALARPPRGRRHMILLGAIALADVALAVPAFDGVLRSWQGLSIICAAAFSLVTVIGAFASGRAAKLEHRHLAVMTGTAAAAVIGALFMLRLFAASVGSPPVYDGSSAVADPLAAELPAALALGVMMLATSALAWADGHLLTERADVTRLRLLEGRMSELDEALPVQEGIVTRVAADREMAVHQLRGIDADLADAERALDALERELIETARREIVRQVGSPVAASGLDLPPVRPASAVTASDVNACPSDTTEENR